jgi:hypothetical protein
MRVFWSTKSDGVRRLSLLTGLTAAGYRFWHPEQGERYFSEWSEFLGIVITCLFYFLTAWLVIRAVAWVVAGFITDKSKNPN